MRVTVLVLMTLAAIGAFALYGTGLAAERTSSWSGERVGSDSEKHGQSHANLVDDHERHEASSNEAVHDADSMDHHEAVAASADGAVHYFNINVDISDIGIQPSSIFIPSEQRVRLVLRNQGSTEHHFRIVGLAPRDLLWASDPEAVREEDVTDEDHNLHHAGGYVPWRATSLAGIKPTGDEVHSYVSPTRRMDVVLFTATNSGTFVVQCLLHPEIVGKVTVFDGAAQPAAPAAATGVQALTRALNRDLGIIDYSGTPGVQVEATYATPEYVTQALGPASLTRLEPERYVVVLVTERLHTANLPEEATAELHVNGNFMPLAGRVTVTDSPHHRITAYQFTRDDTFGRGHQVMTLSLPSGQKATWHLPLLVSAAGGDSTSTPFGLGGQWGLILALLAGMVAAMWPCLFQLTAFFIPTLAGVTMEEASGGVNLGRRLQVLKAALFFIFGFTLVFTIAGALIGLGAQRLGDTPNFEVWQRYLSAIAGVVIIVLALRTAARVRAPLICKMPIFSRFSHGSQGARPHEMMLAGLAFATGCMTCFGAALVVGMVVYVGLAQSPLYGAVVLFLFSLGMGIPLVIAAVAMAKALPMLFKLEKVVPWMGLVSAVIMVGFGILLISGNYMVMSEWVYRMAGVGVGALP